MIILKVKLKSKLNRVMEEEADHVNVDTVSFETLVMQPKKLHEGEFTDVNEASGCNEKYKDVPEEVMPAKTSH